MPALRLVPVGVGDAFSERYYSSSLALVADDGRWLLVDCPHPIRKILHEARRSSGAGLALDRFVGVALTHLHADHASGLEGLGAYWKYVLRRPDRVKLYAGPEVFEAFRRRDEADLFDAAAVTGPQPVGPFLVETRRADHGGTPAYAFRVAAGGRSVGLSGDTRFDPDLIHWLSAADLAVHEACSKELDNPSHTAYERLAGLPDVVRRKLRLIHYPDDFDVGRSVIEPLRQGEEYVV